MSMNSPIEPSTLALIERLVANVAHVRKRAWGYVTESPGVDVREPEYDLRELKRAISVESLFRKAINAHVDRIMQSGWSLNGSNQNSVAYVYRRLREISRAGGYTMYDLLRKMVKSIVGLSNTFGYWVREDTTSTGRGKTYINRYGDEVGALKSFFTLPPEMMKSVTDKYLNVTAWEQHQQQGGNVKRFLTRDIVHIHFDQMEGFVFGTPVIIDCLDDALSLRRMEDLQQIRAHKMSFPFLHGTVGSDEQPLRKDRGGQGELSDFVNKVEKLNFEGFLATDHRHEINAIDTSKSGFDLTETVQYWLSRVLFALGLEKSAGTGGSMTGQTTRTDQLKLTEASMDVSRAFQTAVETGFNEFIIHELLIEGGFSEDIDDEVFLNFNELDRISAAIKENQAAVIFQSNLYTHDEARIAIGRRPFEEVQFEKTNYKLFVEPLAKMKATVAAQSGGGSSKAADNRARPTNQSGTKMGKTTTVNANVDPVLEALLDAANPDLTTATGRELAETLITDHVRQAFHLGVDQYNAEFGTTLKCDDADVRAHVSTVLSAALSGVTDRVAAMNVVYALMEDMEKQSTIFGYTAAADGRKVSWLDTVTGKLVDVQDSASQPNESSVLVCQDWKSPKYYQTAVDSLIESGLAIETGVKFSDVKFDDLLEGRYPLFDAASAYNLVTFLAADTATPTKIKDQVKAKLDAKLADMKLSYADLTEAYDASKAPWGDLDWSEAEDIEHEQRLAVEGKLPVCDAVLTTAARKKLPNSAYCGPDRSFPAHDAAHVRNALARLPQSKLTDEQKARVKACLLRKAKRLGVKVSDEALTPGQITDGQAAGEVQDYGGWDMPPLKPVEAWSTRVSHNDSSVTVHWDAYKKDFKPGGSGESHVAFSVTDGSGKETVYSLLLGNDNEVRKGKKKADDALYVSLRSFKLLNVKDGAYKLNMWIADAEGNMDPELKDADIYTTQVVMDTSAGHHDEYGDGIHRHVTDGDRDGLHEHPHPASNPFGLHLHDGQETPTGAHLHNYSSGYSGPHPLETPGGTFEEE